MSNGLATVGDSSVSPQKIKQSYMIQQFHFWVYIQNNGNQGPKRYLCTCVYSDIVHNSQKVEAAQACISRRVDKQHVVCAYVRILFSLKKEGHSDTCYNLGEPEGHDAK